MSEIYLQNMQIQKFKNENGSGNKPFVRGGKSKNGRYKKLTEKDLLGIYFAEEGREFTSTNTHTHNLNNVAETGFNKINENLFTKPKNIHQEKYTRLLKNSQRKIIVATGPAGTGKTLFATEHGIRGIMQGKYEKLIFTRPSVTVDEDLGYLPGTLEENMAPWVRPIFDVLYQFITPNEVKNHIENKIIEIAPLGFMRGRTFKNSWIVADEMQNSTISQMKMLMTRLGENSRLVITGDLEQYDCPENTNGLEDFLNKFRGRSSSNISNIEFERDDILREEVVKEVLELYSGDVPANYLDTSSSSLSSCSSSNEDLI